MIYFNPLPTNDAYTRLRLDNTIDAYAHHGYLPLNLPFIHRRYSARGIPIQTTNNLRYDTIDLLGSCATV